MKSSNPNYPLGKMFRAHLCGHNPCKVVWKSEKYGVYGPPVHMQPITCMGPAAAPRLPLTAAAAVAEPSTTTTAVVAPTTSSAAAVGEPSTVTTAVAAPTTSCATASEILAAQEVLREKVFRLAREIQTPHAYIGYVAFVLFALAKECQPCCWEWSFKI